MLASTLYLTSLPPAPPPSCSPGFALAILSKMASQARG
eukprot:CAMPEP_0197570434 /NCGR_PEP_ID=MMETSP1320-20131121/40711_1 /TAXON_ID=91990 /ORGANISM="Bolidomonas sp., Strain RCC2347" /LENGTH=37 /DNA_ID= /DNA_START= /DNA_END= /DNA_ORIENTATION=